VVDEVSARAKASNLTVSQWIANAVEDALRKE
jgi:hypothetical protein